jgi:hypothetical protein
LSAQNQVAGSNRLTDFSFGATTVSKAMVSSITTATVSTVTSTAGFAASLGLIAVLTLISLLVAKELASASDERWQRFGRGLNVAIVPLLMVFTAIVAAKVVEVL